MISLIPSKNEQQIADYFKKHNLVLDDFSGCVTASEGENIIGYSLYRLDKDSMTVFVIEPQDDIMLADGILRSTLHVAAENFVLNAFYNNNSPIDLFAKLGFIKDEQEKRLNIDRLFSGCNCKK